MRLSKREARIRRRLRTRSKIQGTADRPRVCIFRSNRHISTQAINDVAGETVAAATTNTKANAGQNFNNSESAKAVAQELAKQLKEKNIDRVVFDRSGYIYHGVVKAFAEALRAADEENHFHF
ncbi:MAG: 50S ribosomal protein L18 [Candidatus Sumerlaeia bacterium]